MKSCAGGVTLRVPSASDKRQNAQTGTEHGKCEKRGPREMNDGPLSNDTFEGRAYS